MNVNVFVSSTSRDMAQDCRRSVIRAIGTADDILKVFKAGHAKAVNMEDWDADYEGALQVCLDKIRVDSTHYLGIFGYLRGFIPKDTGGGSVSITEAEWKHAVEHRGRSCMAVFVPKDHSLIAQELQQRAAALQTADELEAQMTFHAKVLREGTAQQFDDITDLNGRVMRKVVLWAKRGLREAARASQVTSDAAVSPRIPASSDLIQLGRREQLTVFLDSLERFSPLGMKNAGLFLVYGPRGFGHLELMGRLVREVEDNAYVQPRCFVVSAGALWRENGQTAILHALGGEIRSGWEPAQLSELAKKLLDLLRDQDVILQISGLEGYVDGPSAFLNEFWSPLIDTLPKSVPNRLICISSVETKAETLDMPTSGADPAGEQHCPTQPIVLPRLRPFTEPELSFWLRSRLAPSNANLLSQRLMAATEGIPHALYAILADRALWVQ